MGWLPGTTIPTRLGHFHLLIPSFAWILSIHPVSMVHIVFWDLSRVSILRILWSGFFFFIICCICWDLPEQKILLAFFNDQAKSWLQLLALFHYKELSCFERDLTSVSSFELGWNCNVFSILCRFCLQRTNLQKLASLFCCPSCWGQKQKKLI